MINIKRLFTKGILATLALYPQVLTAEEASDVRSITIAQSQIDTMGLPPEERVSIICSGRETSNLCEKLLNDPSYRDLWLNTADKLTQIEWLLVENLVELGARIDRENETIKYMIDRAPKLPDGRAIFRAENGQYFDIDGNVISADLVAAAE